MESTVVLNIEKETGLTWQFIFNTHIGIHIYAPYGIYLYSIHIDAMHIPRDVTVRDWEYVLGITNTGTVRACAF